jgi:hypothetical protein
MTKDEALKLALEALDIVKLQYTQNRHVNEAITAIKEALAQPEQEQEQEPVAWITTESAYRLKQGGNYNGTGSVHAKQTYAAKNPLYAAPLKRKWVELTEEEIDDIYWQHQNRLEHQVSIWPYERAIEAKLKEKNA